MPNPRRKISKSKRDMRRATWAARLKAPGLSECSNCGTQKLPHHACPNCGYYKDTPVFTPEEG